MQDLVHVSGQEKLKPGYFIVIQKTINIAVRNSHSLRNADNPIFFESHFTGRWFDEECDEQKDTGNDDWHLIGFFRILILPKSHLPYAVRCTASE
jgi:hypothetical protein